MRRSHDEGDLQAGGAVARRAAPSQSRAAAAARLAGAPSGSDAVRRRLAEAARRAERGASDRHPAASAQSRSVDGRSPVGRPPAATRRAPAIADPSAVAGIFSAGAAGLAAAPAEPARPAPKEQPRPRHLKVVEPGTLSPRQRRRRARAALVGAIAAGSFIAFALVYLHVVLAQRQFHIDRINADVSKAQTSYQNLRLQVAQLGSPQQIISTAEGRLGMVQPQKVVYLTPPAGASSSSAQQGGQTGQSAGQTAPSSGQVASASGGAVAPSGNADWPVIKSQLAGAP